MVLQTDSLMHRVEIIVKATRKADVAVGKSVVESKQYVIIDDYSEEELQMLLSRIEPLSSV